MIFQTIYTQIMFTLTRNNNKRICLWNIEKQNYSINNWNRNKCVTQALFTPNYNVTRLVKIVHGMRKRNGSGCDKNSVDSYKEEE